MTWGAWWWPTPLVAFEEVEIRLNGTNICQTHQHPRIIIIIIIIVIIIIIIL